MLLNRKIAANSFWLLLSRLANQALAVVFSILVARSLGEAGLGQFAFISALVFLANVVTTFGTDTLLMREIATTRSTRTSSLGAVLWLQLGLSVTVIVGILIGAPYLPGISREGILAFQFYALALVPLAFYTVFSAALRAYERMDLFLLANLVFSLAQTCGALLLALLKTGLLTLVGVIVLSQLLAALFAAYACYRWLPDFSIPWRMPIRSIAGVLRLGWVLALLAGLGVLYQRMGVLLLPSLAGNAATGWFSAAVRVSESFKILHYAVLGALFPVLAHSFYLQSSSPGVARLSGPSSSQAPVRILYFFTLVTAITVTFLARPLVMLLFGARYAPSALILQVLVWGLLPYTYAAKVSLELVAAGRERWVAAALALAVLATAPLYFLLVRRFGLVGAALAALAGESIHAVGLFAAGVGIKFATLKSPELPVIEEKAENTVQPGDSRTGPDEPILTAANLLAHRRSIGVQPRFQPPEAVILCFHRKALEKAARRHRVRKAGGFYGDLFLLNETGGKVALAGNIGVGAPAAVVLLEDLAAFGVRRFVAVGTAGGLQSDLLAGDLVLCDRAAREEGVSRHYLEAAPFAFADPGIVQRLARELEKLRHPYRIGASWTMDAPYRELRREVLYYQQAGVLTVEMEAAALFAAGQALNLQIGAAFCVADSLADLEWQPEFNSKDTLAGLELLIEAAILAIREG